MLSLRLVDFIKKWEGFRAKAYRDVAGVLTIGYGSTGYGFKEGDVWTETQAEERLKQDLLKFQNGVLHLVTCKIMDCQLDALTSFSYNLGLGNLKSSTLLKYVNKQEFAKAGDEFLKWKIAGGQVSKGLLKRRQAERAMFLGESV